MLFMLVFHKCLYVYIESVLSNYFILSGKSTVLFDRILIYDNAVATSCPVSLRYILNIIPPPHKLSCRSSSHQTAVDILVEKHESDVSLNAGRSWEGNMNVYLKELSAGVIIEGRA